MTSVKVEDVLALLTPTMVVTACGVDARERGRVWRFRTCPACGQKPKRQGAAIYRRRRDNTWRWTHHGHACGGDLLDLIAAAESIDRRHGFVKLLERAAQVAGMTPTDPNLERRIAERVAADRAQRERDDREEAAALAAMPGTWESLERRSLVGERYLQLRGLDPAALRASDSVRFSTTGELAVAMRSLTDGAIVGIQYRATAGKGFHSAAWSDADNSALLGKPSDIDPDGVDVAVVVEGLADTLAARLAFPGCAVYGAAGAGRLADIVESLVAHVMECRGWLLLIPHDDEPGIERCVDAMRVARDAGLVLDRSMFLVDLGKFADLADAWKSGWRWTWPMQTGGAG